jgi:hypothetical protein
MADPRLIRADATKLDELRDILAQQKGAEKLRPIEMKDIFIGHGAVSHVTGSGEIAYPRHKDTDGHRSHQDNERRQKRQGRGLTRF